MRTPGLFLALAMAALSSAPTQAEPISEAVAAITVEDYEGARAILLAPELRRDPEALTLLAGLTRDGLGGPVDLIEAYMLYSLAFQLAPPDDAMDAAGERHVMAHEMTPADIVEAEARVVARIDAEIGADKRHERIAALATLLRMCGRNGPDCGEVMEQVIPYGPAAADLVPDVERLMTQDPKWMPRQVYSITLAMIGTAAVPALCRLLLDERELSNEGTWNAQLVARRIGLMGDTAAAARPCLLKALTRDYDESSIGSSEIVSDFGASPYEIVLDLKREIAGTIADVGDRAGEIRDPMLFYFMSEWDLKTKLLVGWSYGLTYHDGGPALSLMPKALASEDGQAQLWALYILYDVVETPQFPQVAARLEPLVRALTDSHDPETSDAAKRALEAFPPLTK